MKECLVFENCVRSLSFHSWKSFSSLINFDGMKNLENLNKILSSLEKHK